MNRPIENPFQVPTAPATDPGVTEADPARQRWGIAASGPPLNPAEIESSSAALEVIVMWGEQDVLHVEHLDPPRDVILGEGADAAYLLGEEALGTSRLPVVVERGGQLFCVIPEGADGCVRVQDAERTFAALEAEGKLAPLESVAGARLYPLPDGATARVRHRGFTFLVRPTPAGKRLAAGAEIQWRRYGWVGLSVAVHAAFLVMFYFLPPSSHALSLDNITAADRLVQYIDPADAHMEEELPTWVEEQPSEEPGGTGERHAGDEGQSGREDSAHTNRRYAVEGDPNDPNPELARDRVRDQMQTVGAIGAVRSLLGSWNVPTSPYGADQAHGNDPMSAIGALMGEQMGDSFGYNGLGLNGTGRGAGGFGLGTVGLGTLGTLGHGDGRGPGQGYGDGAGALRDRRPPSGPTVRMVQASVVGALSQEAIRRVVRRHLAEVRFCYEQGLQQNPSIEGRVTVNWIISPTGAVQSSRVGGSNLGDARVESCIASAVRRWSFPQPDGGGPVGVNYPFVLRSS